MNGNYQLSIFNKISWVLLIIFTVWWVILHLLFGSNDTALQLYAASYGIMALWGGAIGMYISKKWGGVKSIIGKSLFFFSLGLLFQEFGQLAYSYYIYFAHIDVPYPSVGDVGFFGSILWYGLGVLYLGRAAGVRVGLQSWSARVQSVILPLSLLFLSYTLFLKGHDFEGSTFLQNVLDFGYPLGQAIYVSLALLIFTVCHNVLGGAMRRPTQFILVALVVQYAADFSFLYLSSRELWTVGGINDYMYLFSYFLMAKALLECQKAFERVRGE